MSYEEQEPWILNGEKFYEAPDRCYKCKFWHNGQTDNPISVFADKGLCILFDEMHRYDIAVPRRCAKLFRKMTSLQRGQPLVVVGWNGRDAE